MQAGDGLERKTGAAWLFAFYGPLLTPNRREILRLYLEEDMSLSEIAAEQGITRQGVHVALSRACARLYALEETLGLAGRFMKTRRGLRAALDALNAGHADVAGELIAEMLRRGEEDEDGF